MSQLQQFDFSKKFTKNVLEETGLLKPIKKVLKDNQ